MKITIMLWMCALPLFCNAMEKPAMSPFGLLAEETKEHIISDVLTGNTLEEIVKNAHRMATTNKDFRRLLTDQVITKKIVDRLIEQFPDETNKNPMVAAILLGTPGVKYWLNEHHSNWQNDIKEFVMKSILGNQNTLAVVALLKNKTIASHINGYPLPGGLTALMVVAYRGVPKVDPWNFKFPVHKRLASDVLIAKELLAAGANPNIQDQEGNTALMYALPSGADINMHMVQTLLVAGADPHMPNKAGVTALTLVENRIHILKFPLLRSFVKNRGSIDMVVQEYPDLVKRFVIDQMDSYQDISMVAAFLENEIIANYFIREYVAPDGMTLLMWAADNGYVSIVQALLKAGADPNILSREGETPLRYASRYLYNTGNIKDVIIIMQALLNAGADPNLRSHMYGTALITVALSGANSVPMVKLLLNAGADPNLQDQEGNTALMYAALRNNLPVVQALLAADANPTIKNNGGQTALMMAKDQSIVKALAEAAKQYIY